MKKRGICIGGYAGCGNLGDDAILQGYLEGLSPCQRRWETVVLSGDPKRDQRRFGVRCVGRKNPISVLRSFLRAERFLCGGGSLLQNGTGNLSLCYYLGLLLLARLCGCRTELLASGIGPLRGRAAVRFTVWTLKKCHRIELRDEKSAELLTEWGIPAEKIRIREDPALTLKPPPLTRLLFLRKEWGIAEGQAYFCVVVRREHAQKCACLKKITAAVRLFSRQQGMIPVFMVFDVKEDQRITQEVCRDVEGMVVGLREASDALSMLSGSRFLISMRLHALVFSAAVGIPAVGISPSDEEPKLSSFCHSHRMPHFTPAELTVAKLLDEMEKLQGD